MTLGTRINSVRKAMKVTQHELAKKIGVAQSLIAYLENGTKVGSTHVASIARALNVDAHWLQTGEGSKELAQHEAEKKYYREIEEAIKLMESTDERGRAKMLIALQDALDAHKAWQNSLPRAQERDEKDCRLLGEGMLTKVIENEEISNDVYKRNENHGGRKDKRH